MPLYPYPCIYYSITDYVLSSMYSPNITAIKYSATMRSLNDSVFGLLALSRKCSTELLLVVVWLGLG